MAEIPGIEPEALAETGAGMTANMASAAVQADPEGAADLAGAMMEVMADIPNVPEEFDMAGQMADMTTAIATQATAAAPEQAA